MVLAKVADPGDPSRTLPGVKGISLFIVPKHTVKEDGTLGEPNDVTLAGLNKKMGCKLMSERNCITIVPDGHFREGGHQLRP